MREQLNGRQPRRMGVAGIVLLAVLFAWPAALWAQQPTNPQAAERKGVVNNVWMDTPLVQVLRDISTQVGVAITLDPVMADLPVSLEAHDLSLSECLARITMGKGLAVRQVEPGLYVVGSDKPGSPSFTVVSDSMRVPLKYVTARHVRDSLPTDLKPYVSSGERTTEVQIFAPPEKMARIVETVKQMDVPVPQIVLEALVVELSRGSDKEAGIDWAVAGGNAAFSLENGAGAFAGAARYTTVSERNFTAITAALNLLVSTGKAKIRSRPRVATLNGMTATIDVSLEKFFAIITDVQATYLRTQLQSVKSGVILKMEPQVGGDGDITLHVATEVSDVVTRNTEIAGLQDPLPLIRRRNVESYIRVKSGEAIVIGGLIESQVRDEVKRVPILGSIPLLGALFTSKKASSVENEVIIFIKPHIMAPAEAALQGGHETIDVEKEHRALQAPSSPRSHEKDALDQPTTGETW
jgi:type II secretory pathway component GspD/PulD (secretin)